MKKNFNGKMIVFTAPSGAGKTTVVRHLLKTYSFLGFSISATNREKRAHEVDGKDYHFFDTDTFLKKVHNSEFIEHEEVYQGQYYGTLKSEIDRLWREEKHIVFDIDVRGATSIKNIYGDKCLVIFIKPPSLNVIVERLKNRKTETEASLIKRIKRIKKELTYENYFDTIIVNDMLDVCLKDAELKLESFLGIKEWPISTEEE